MSLFRESKSCCASPRLAAKIVGRKSKGQGAAPGRGRDDVNAVVPVIRACARAKDMKGALAAFDSVQASGATLSAQVHNCLIEAYLQCEDFTGALKHFREVASSGTADVVTYNTVLKALLSLGHTTEAKKLLVEMSQRGLPATRVTYHQLLNAEVCTG